MSSCQAQTEQEVLVFEPEEMVDQAADLEGYASLKEWSDAYQANITEYTGKAAIITEEFDGYITEEQIQQLTDLENSILNAETIQEQKDAIDKINVIIEELNNYKKTKY